MSAANQVQEAVKTFQLGHHERGITKLKEILARDPASVAAHVSLSIAYCVLKQWDFAVAYAESALAIDVDHAEALHYRALAYAGLGQHETAVLSYREALRLSPNSAGAYVNCATSLRQLGLFSEAESMLLSALGLRPNFPEALFNLGNLYRDLELLGDASLSFERAVELKPDFSEAWLNSGLLDKQLGDVEGASFKLSRCLATNPKSSEAHFGMALLSLLQGKLNDGFLGYEWRWMDASLGLTNRFPEIPKWLGPISILSGKNLLIQSEQGLGDTIWVSRFLDVLCNAASRVVFEVQAPLHRLFEFNFGNRVSVVTRGTSIVGVDFQVPLMSLPLAVGVSFHSIPNAAGYLRSDPAAVRRWSGLLGKATRRRIGVAWKGNASYKRDAQRSFLLSEFISALPPDFDYVAVQIALSDDERSLLASRGIAEFESSLVDFYETAALCANLDLMVSVDTSVAHLTASMGVPTWIIVPSDPDFRWLLARQDSPWYEQVRLYRQRLDNRLAVLETIREDLLILDSALT
jgi:tetratricopeptide (TPR) repeat protein